MAVIEEVYDEGWEIYPRTILWDEGFSDEDIDAFFCTAESSTREWSCMVTGAFPVRQPSDTVYEGAAACPRHMGPSLQRQVLSPTDLEDYA